jgi:adenylosuccinate synthase
MSITAVVGANWGDEGKGKITDFLAGDADVVVRFQGGNNAGHTVINDYGKFALHLLPSGVFRAGTTNVLGAGVAVNIQALLAEREGLIQRGVPAPVLKVSDRAQVVMPYHVLLDQCEEERLGAKAFGSTRTGIAPFYADKCLKLGVQVGELPYPDRVRARIEQSLATKNALIEHLYSRPPILLDSLLEELRKQGDAIRAFVCNAFTLLRDATAAGRRILLEGQLGALRDPDSGVYPYPTSSSPLAGFAAVGAPVPARMIDRVVAVTKAYSTCVGAGPFVTELTGAAADELRRRGGDVGEYGATTGRPRRVGWFDAVATRYGCQLQAATEVALTNLDVLGYLDEICICTAYRIGGTPTGDFLVTALLDDAQPVCETMPGWRCDIRGVTRWDHLPMAARSYVSRIEELIGVPISIISTGPHRRDTILRRPLG